MEEKLDVLDENGDFTGKSVSREEAHLNGDWHRAVVLFIVNSKKQVLLQKRSTDKKKWPGCWDVTSGGHVDAGELGLMAAVRELYEELGIKIEPKDVRYISGCRSNNRDGKMRDAHFNEFFVAFKDVDTKDIKMQESEVEAFNWVDFEEFKKLIRNKDPKLTTKWEAYKALIDYIEKYGFI
jgi:isopentenyl-diphosphate delta-isomerase type 1